MPYIMRTDDISVLGLSNRALNCLRREHINTIGELLEYPQDMFIYIRNMGTTTVEEVLGVIKSITNGTSEFLLNDCEKQIPSITSSINPDGSISIAIDEYGKILGDIEITSLSLSIRAKNCLIHNGYKYASQLIGITHDDLINIQNLGSKTANEIIDFSKRISTNHIVSSNTNIEQTSYIGNLVQELSQYCPAKQSEWLKEVLITKTEYPEATGETFIYHLYDRAFVRKTTKDRIIQIVEENNNEISKASLKEHLPYHLNNTTILEEMLIELEVINAIEIGDILIYRKYPSILDYASKIEDNRIREVIQSRLEGKTLTEIGERYNITRERVRQLMAKGLDKRPRLREDKYTYLYDHYNFSLEDFLLAYDEHPETYYYLEMISNTQRINRKPLDIILTDTQISVDYRKRAERAIYKQYISTDGVRVKITRPTLVKHFVKTYCKDLTEYDVFLKKYHEWLNSLDLSDNPTLVIESSRTYENKMNQCDYVLWNQWRSFRYYNIQERDYDDLLSTINLMEYKNTEISSLKLFRDYPEIMKSYDIRDEYELHNLLKKIWDSADNQIVFSKMPTIEIGTINRDNQVLELLLQYAPISSEKFGELYEQAYGIKAARVLGGYMSAFDPYYFDGVYSIDFAALPLIQQNKMKEVLTLDFYTIHDIKRLYKREFKNADDSLINSYTLKTLGFRVYSGYVIKNIYPSASDYFRFLLTKEDIVDTRNLSKSIHNLTAYYSEVYKLRENYEIVEFSPQQYINIRRLNALGITTEHFKNYCKTVSNHFEKGEFFTITSLRQGGFVHELDELGFDDWFYASILLEDKDSFSYQRVGNTRIFMRGNRSVTLGEMLIWILEKYQKIDIYDLLELLQNHYGIKTQKDKTLAIIDGTELYYDTIMEAVYIDYNTYFEEI